MQAPFLKDFRFSEPSRLHNLACSFRVGNQPGLGQLPVFIFTASTREEEVARL